MSEPNQKRKSLADVLAERETGGYDMPPPLQERDIPPAAAAPTEAPAQKRVQEFRSSVFRTKATSSEEAEAAMRAHINKLRKESPNKAIMPILIIKPPSYFSTELRAHIAYQESLLVKDEFGVEALVCVVPAGLHWLAFYWLVNRSRIVYTINAVITQWRRSVDMSFKHRCIQAWVMARISWGHSMASGTAPTFRYIRPPVVRAGASLFHQKEEYEYDREKLKSAYSYANKAWRMDLNVRFETAWLIIYAIRDNALRERGIVGVRRLENQVLRRKINVFLWYCAVLAGGMES